IMDFFKASLGVKCGFCHAPDPDTGKLNFASDEKPEKDIARYMLRMTAGINKEYFNFNKTTNTDTIHAVTCYTCHNGNPHPEGMPKMDDNHMMPPNHPPIQDGQTPNGSGMQHDSLMKPKS
ncbi:MAG: c-type cytochrome, partial [Bacteroidota bacterium]|nr:c-type cytochrome [Bacteroidota bacterium]